MPSYKWKCLACDESNEAENENCVSCNCPSSLTTDELNEWKKHGKFRPQDPSILEIDQHGRSRSPFMPVAPCASCGLLMYVRDNECPKCGHEHTDAEKETQKQHAKGKGNFDYRITIIFWIFFIALAYLFFSNI